MFLHVTKAKPLDNYRVEVYLNDGRQSVAYLTEALKGAAFQSLKEPEKSDRFVNQFQRRSVI